MEIPVTLKTGSPCNLGERLQGFQLTGRVSSLSTLRLRLSCPSRLLIFWAKPLCRCTANQSQSYHRINPTRGSYPSSSISLNGHSSCCQPSCPCHSHFGIRASNLSPSLPDLPSQVRRCCARRRSNHSDRWPGA